jgi:putative hydrolase
LLYGDYHTHTTYSHGKGSIEDNVRAAREKGLKEVAVTDHGLGHIVYNVKRKYIGKMRDEIEALKRKYPDINILLGIEANLTGRGGSMDMTDAEKELFDIVLCGYHVTVHADRWRERYRFFTPNFFARTLFGYSKSLVRTNTRAYINLVEKNKVDVLTHINLRIRADAAEVAKAARDNGTYIEISGKRTGCSDDEIAAMAATGVQFIVNSDAHRPERVGGIQFALDIIDRLGIPYGQIANWDKRPEFRSEVGIPRQDRDAPMGKNCPIDR